MDIVILDLEWNGSYSKRIKGYINEIIEFGAVKCDENLNFISKFSCFVKPQVGKKISSVISNLTSITDEHLTDGVSFMNAVRRFRKWSGDSVIMTWGTSDILALIENCRYFSGDGKVPFLHEYCDLQVYAQMKLGEANGEQMGLITAADKLGIKVDENELHRAYEDSMLSFDVLKKVYDREKIKAYTELCDEEFYRKITFKTAYINNLKNPLVEKKHLRFSCPKCKGRTVRKTHWSQKNRSFRAEFICRECGYPFAGRLILKEKYEGINVNKKTFPVPIIEKPREAKEMDVGNMHIEIAKNGVSLLKFKGMSDIVTHAFSTRIGGVSTGDYEAMNLGFGRGDSEENVKENYKLFAAAMNVEPEGMICGAQDHNINIRRVDKENAGTGIWKPKDMESIDGLVTNDKDVTLIIYCADCVPIYFVDERNHAIGLAHAGWKGTASGMAKAMAERMRDEFGSDLSEIKVAIGPSISKKNFEVDLPVAEVFMQLPKQESFVEDSHDGKYHVDLWECNKMYLLEAGVKAENIIIGEVCSMDNSDLVFSHRKTRGRRGGNAAALKLN